MISATIRSGLRITHVIRRFFIQSLSCILVFLPGMEVDHSSSRATLHAVANRDGDEDRSQLSHMRDSRPIIPLSIKMDDVKVVPVQLIFLFPRFCVSVSTKRLQIRSFFHTITPWQKISSQLSTMRTEHKPRTLTISEGMSGVGGV